ncbi:DIP1281 family NlpC/P60 protein [Corynebacterium sp. H113]|uniref:DIP1281 family NlpC/P60 protein n=1 Tax=Corynebacterium sp. H113 TaxID=3133419 RepID=UPI0030954236
MALSRNSYAKGWTRPVAGVVVAAFIATNAQTASATPQRVSDDTIAQAEGAARDANNVLQTLVSDVSTRERAVAELELRMGTLREDVNKSMVDLDRARSDADKARSAVDDARAVFNSTRKQLREAQQEFDKIARSVMRQGNNGSPSLNGAEGVSDALNRAAALRREADKQRAIVERLDRARSKDANAESDLRAKKNRAEQAEDVAAKHQTDAQTALDEATAALQTEQAAYDKAVFDRDSAQAALDAARKAVEALNADSPGWSNDAERRKAENEAAQKAADSAVEQAEQDGTVGSGSTSTDSESAHESTGSNGSNGSTSTTQDESAEESEESTSTTTTTPSTTTPKSSESAQSTEEVETSDSTGSSDSAASTDNAEPTDAAESTDDADTSSTNSDSTDSDSSDSTTDNAESSSDSTESTAGTTTGTTVQTSTPSNPEEGSTSSGSRDQQIELVISRAMAQLGQPYAWGGGDANGPTKGIRDGGVADSHGDYNKIGFDCSGLTLYAYAAVGITLPHYTGYQYQKGTHYPVSQMQRGDLLFWGPNGHGHVAIYLGDGTMIEAPQSGDVVKISPVRYNGMTPNVVRLL